MVGIRGEDEVEPSIVGVVRGERHVYDLLTAFRMSMVARVDLLGDGAPIVGVTGRDDYRISHQIAGDRPAELIEDVEDQGVTMMGWVPTD